MARVPVKIISNSETYEVKAYMSTEVRSEYCLRLTFDFTNPLHGTNDRIIASLDGHDLAIIMNDFRFMNDLNNRY